MVGYRIARRFVLNGLLRRMREGTFTIEQQDLFIEWVIQIGMRDKSSELAIF